MSSNSPMRRSMARVEFFACMELVESMLGQGFSTQLVYEKLKEKGDISMAYATFAKLIAKAAKDDLPIKSLRPSSKPASPPAKPQPPVSRPAQPNIIKAKPDGLQDPRTVDPSTII